MKTLYDLLGVSRYATLADIEHGYHHCLNRHFAGNRGGVLRKQDRVRVQMLRQAYLVLSSPVRRRKYDHTLLLREQRRNRLLDIGGAILAVLSLLIGLLMMAGAPYFHAQQGGKHAAHAPQQA